MWVLLEFGSYSGVGLFQGFKVFVGSFGDLHQDWTLKPIDKCRYIFFGSFGELHQDWTRKL